MSFVLFTPSFSFSFTQTSRKKMDKTLSYKDLILYVSRKHGSEEEHHSFILTDIDYPITHHTATYIMTLLRRPYCRSITIRHNPHEGFDPNFRIDGIFSLFRGIVKSIPLKSGKTITIESEIGLPPGVDVAVSVPRQTRELSTIFKELKEVSKRVTFSGTIIIGPYTRSSFSR